MKECVVILGMHRSGTSVISGLVSLQGYYLGLHEMPKTKDNEKGYYENSKVSDLNQSILIDHNTYWDDYSFTFDKIKPEDLRSYKENAKKIIKEEFGLVKRIFIKDPRMCLLFPLWESVLKQLNFNIKVILAYRSPMEVANSLIKRDEIPVEKSLMMWSHHLLQAEKVSRGYNRFIVQYDKDLRDLDSYISKLADFLSVELNQAMRDSAHDLYSPNLKHHQLEMDNVSNEIPSYLKNLISILQCNKLEYADEMDSIASEFYYSQRLYLYNENNLHRKIKSLETELVEVKRQLQAEKNEVVFKVNEINSHKREIENHKKYIENAKNDYKNLLSEYTQKKEALEARVKNKEAEFRAEKKALSNEIHLLNDKLDTGLELFNRVYKSRRFKNKLARNMVGNRYYKNLNLLSVVGYPNKQLLKDKIEIIDSGLFSPFYYLTQNLDVWRAGVDPLNHFCKFGWKEGRNPSQYFDCEKYLKKNPDVKKSGKNPLLHYIRYGRKEGRSSEADNEAGKDVLQCEEVSVTDAACVMLKNEITKNTLPDVPRLDEIFVSIIVLTRDGLEHLKILLPSLYKNTQGIKYELIIVDNNSSDGTIDYLENCVYDFDLRIIKNTQNETFSKANNQASKQAKGDYLVLLNNDVEPLKGWLHHLLNMAESNNDVGSVGARLVYPYKKTFKRSCLIQHAGIAFRDEKSFFRPFNQGNGVLIDSPTVNNSGQKSAVTAACLLVKTEAYKAVAGLDEGYNYGFEDVDFGLKLLHAGYHNYYCAESVLFHYEFGTQNKNNRREVIARRERNAALLKEKWHQFIKFNYWEEKLFNKSHLFAESCLNVAIAVTDYGKDVTAGDYFTAQEIATYLEEFGWTVNYLSRKKNEWYQLDESVDVLISLLDAYDLHKLPTRTKRLYTIAWARNWFDRWCEMPCFNDYDLVFASSHKSCAYVRENSLQEPLLLPIASNIKRFTEKPDCNNNESYKSDICFTGSYWNTPRDIMTALSEDALAKYQFNVYGANWDKFEKFKPYNKGFIAYEDIPCVYHNTKIVIDDANHVTKPYGAVNSRVFDALMSDALVITNGIEGSKDLFSGELPHYTTQQDLDELLVFYLDNEEERQKKVKQLKEIVLSKHTYKHRAESIRSALVKRFMSQSIAIKMPCPTWEGAYSWGDYHMAVLLKSQLEEHGFYVLLQILPEWDNDEGMECDSVIVFRGLSRYTVKPHQINIMWNISHPDKVTLDEYEEYDKVFIASDYWAKKIGKQVSTSVETMLQCTDPNRFHEPSDSEKEDFHQQLLFVGNSREVYRKALKDLLPTDYDLAVYGKRWKNIIPKHYIKGEYISNEELYKYYGSADILLNDHWDDMREQGFVSNRIFDGLACGAFILTDKVKGMGELENYVGTYNTSTELKDNIAYYLDNADKRLTMAKEGMKYVRENHTFKQRAIKFAEFIKEISGKNEIIY